MRCIVSGKRTRLLRMFGPFRDANVPALTEALQKVERYPGETMRLYRGISGNAPLFVKAADAILSTGRTPARRQNENDRSSSPGTRGR